MGCRTAAGEYAADEVYRDDRVVAVVSQHAVNPGHLVVVTLEHVRNALVMDDALLCHLMLVGRKLGRQLQQSLPCSGVMLALNNDLPCQTVFHAHLHVVPREPGDRMDIQFASSVAVSERETLARRLRTSHTGSA